MSPNRTWPVLLTTALVAADPASTDRAAAAGTVDVHDEIGAQACYTRAGDRATITYSWGAVGRAETGSLTFQLYDCTAKVVEPAMSHTVNLPEPDPTRGGKGRETFTVKAGRRYQPRVFGEGAYDRTGAGADGPDTGYFSRTGTPPFTGEGSCQ
jgi:hypothetical protein